jgi:hypothetical protein
LDGHHSVTWDTGATPGRHAFADWTVCGIALFTVNGTK